MSGQELRAEIPVPLGPASCDDLLPVLRSLTDAVVQIAAGGAEAQGRTISCRPGCAACCRQLVPVSPSESRALHRLIDGLPEPRRVEVLGRFDEARRKVEAAGLLGRLGQAGSLSEPERELLGEEYFALGIACPFLEDERCSIYEERPIACREYLVTSPAEHCARLSLELIECVPIAARVSNAVAGLDRDGSGGAESRVALTLAPEWAESRPNPSADQTGPELLRELFERLCGNTPTPGAA